METCESAVPAGRYADGRRRNKHPKAPLDCLLMIRKRMASPPIIGDLGSRGSCIANESAIAEAKRGGYQLASPRINMAQNTLRGGLRMVWPVVGRALAWPKEKG